LSQTSTRNTEAPGWCAILIGAAVATALALAARWLAPALGIEKLLFGFAAGVDTADAPASMTRTALYPLFLAALRPFGTPVILAVQSYLYFVAGIALFARFARLLAVPRWLRAFALWGGIASLFNPRVLEYPLSISEEALFISAMMGALAALVMHIARPRLLTAAAAGLLVGATIGVRPIGIAFVPMLIVALLAPAVSAFQARATWRRSVLGILVAGAALAAAVAFEWAAHSAMIGSAGRSTVFGLNVVGKVPFIIEPGDLTAGAPEEAEALREVEAVLLRSAAFARAAEASLTTFDGRQFFTNYAEFAFQMRAQSPELIAAMERLGKIRGRPAAIVAAEVSLVVIRKRPLRFAARVLGNVGRLVGLAEMPGAGGLADVDRLAQGLGRAWFAGPPGVGFRRPREVAAAYVRPAWALRAVHAAALLGIGAALCMAAYAAIRRRKLSSEAALGLIVSAGFLGYVVLCAVVINAQVRYILTIWPLTALLGLLALAVAAHIFGARGSPPAA
jgi:hypothetical protein